MSNSCDSNCASCSESSCDDRKQESLLKKPLDSTKIKNIIGVVSGKGGVGKSMTTSILAVNMAKKGYKVGVLDADITGPSIPKMFGVHEKVFGTDEGMLPAVTKDLKIKLMSVNLMLETEETPVLWRGVMVSNLLTQFYTDIVWGELDYLFIDMPPGTGDVALTTFQSIPVDGLVIVTSPQELVSMIVSKACNMAEMMHIPVVGLMENMSYVECPKCGEKIYIFNKSNIDETAEKHNLKVLGKMPIKPEIAALADAGKIEEFGYDYLDIAIEEIGNM
jgi:Mrp family chromosome partitioning ATPase